MMKTKDNFDRSDISDKSAPNNPNTGNNPNISDTYKLKRQFKILWMLFKMKLSKSMIFRFSFFGVLLVDGSLFLLQLMMFSAIYSQVDSVGGWNREEMLLFIGTFSLINALNMTLYFFGLISIPGKIRSGELDTYITKPVNPLFHLSFESIDVGSVPLVFASIGIVIYALSGMTVEITVLKVISYILLVLLMLVLHYNMMVIFRTLPFFFIRLNSIENLEGEMIELCIKIPGTLFEGLFKVLFYVIFPYGIMATVPAQLLAGTLTPSGLVTALLIVVVFTLFTHFFWKTGLRNYKSASS